MIDWEARKREVLELNNHPVRHIPEFGGLGMSLCGVFSYSWQREKPLCAKCEELNKQRKKSNGAIYFARAVIAADREKNK